WVAPKRMAWWLPLLLVGCGTPNPKIRDSEEVEPFAVSRTNEDLSEADKIRKLIEVVRTCDAAFVHPEGTHDGTAEADSLECRVARMSISTARQFVDVLGAPKKGKGSEVRVRLVDGSVLPAKDWYLARLEEIEGVPAASRRTKKIADASLPVTLGILDA